MSSLAWILLDTLEPDEETPDPFDDYERELQEHPEWTA